MLYIYLCADYPIFIFGYERIIITSPEEKGEPLFPTFSFLIAFTFIWSQFYILLNGILYLKDKKLKFGEISP